jgi:TRAP-type uncharacterized transport system substrate-binding protein
MRAIFPMYDTPFQFLVLENSGTQSVAEMVGKRVGVGPRGGTSAAYFPEFFRKLNVSVNFVFGEWAELAAQVHRRELDVLAAGAGVPVPSFLELEARDKGPIHCLQSGPIGGIAPRNAGIDSLSHSCRHVSVTAAEL